MKLTDALIYFHIQGVTELLCTMEVVKRETILKNNRDSAISFFYWRVACFSNIILDNLFKQIF